MHYNVKKSSQGADMRCKGLMLSLAAAATMVTAADFELTPVAGYVVKEGNLDLENEWVVGGELQFNQFDSVIKPEVALLYTPEDEYDDNVNETSITRIGLNGVYEYEKLESVIPFAKVGVGYEHMSKRLYENDSELFVGAGGGVKFPISDALALKLEAFYMLKDPAGNKDSNLATLVGLSIPFGGEAQPEPAKPEPVKAPEPAPVAEAPKPAPVLDSDGDGVNDTADACPNTPKGAPVDAKGCALDSDNDGVIDLLDKCPGTPEGFKVDAEGCPVTMDLALTYETNSAKIDAVSTPKVLEFGKFLMENPGYNIHVIGHTDNRGAAAYNQKLSERRADSVRNMLVEQGIDAGRITTEGKGEASPKADNTTAEGRQANRRIEVQLQR
jgi:OOP family OmpA-OmpF porin